MCADETWRGLENAVALAADLHRTDRGESITDHASSWVRAIDCGSERVFVKTYEFATWPARIRALWRWCGPWARSRAHREFEALTWLREHGFPAPRPIAALEIRHLGCLVRATLVTAEFPGQPADRLLPNLLPAAQRDLARAIGHFVGALHRLGFRDRNLDLRNLLVQQVGGDFKIAKIDSGRYRLRSPGRAHDALARADWQRLLNQLPEDLAHEAIAERDRATH